jgi:hypothetical protein
MIKDNTRLLMICPTRSRPVRVLEALKCFYETKSEGTEICFVVSADDPCLEEYQANLAGEEVVVCDSRYIIPKINHVAVRLHPNLLYYGSIDDDQHCRTKGWDAKLIQTIEAQGGMGVACGDDLFTKNWHEFKHPAGYIMSGNIIQALGYMVNPSFRHTGIDYWFAELFDPLILLYFLPEVIIEHMHVNVGKAPNDEQYDWIYGDEMKHGMEALHNWRVQQKGQEMQRLKNALRSKRVS